MKKTTRKPRAKKATKKAATTLPLNQWTKGLVRLVKKGRKTVAQFRKSK